MRRLTAFLTTGDAAARKEFVCRAHACGLYPFPLAELKLADESSPSHHDEKQQGEHGTEGKIGWSPLKKGSLTHGRNRIARFAMVGDIACRKWPTVAESCVGGYAHTVSRLRCLQWYHAPEPTRSPQFLLISHWSGLESSFLEDFLLTYRTFLTPHALLLMLILRYWVPLGQNEEHKKECIPIQIKYFPRFGTSCRFWC